MSSLSADLRAQAPDYKGTDFLVAFPQNLAAPLQPTLTLFVGNDSATDVKFEVSGPGLTTTQFTVLASSVHAGVLIPASQQVTAMNAISSKGIRVRSLDPPTAEIAVYGLSRKPSFADAYVGLPLDVLGTEYRVVSWPGPGAQATVVGMENGTSVTITTPVDTTGFSAGVPRTIPLNRLETFLLQGGDLTGTRVTSDKPVAVFGGNQQAAVPGGTSFDYMVEQMPPVPTWGREFVVAPIAPRAAGDIVRVLAHEGETEISLNGILLTTLDAGSFVEFTVPSTAGSWITTSKPVLVAHYNKGQGQGDSVSTDPFMMLGVPVDQFTNRYLIRTPGTPFTTAMSNRLSIVVKDGDEVGLLLDGAMLPTGTVWTSVSNSGYSYTRVTVVPGIHRIDHQEPTVRFGAWVYGHALAEGYGYVAGQLIADQTPPALSVPDSVTVEATRPGGATVTWDDPTATDFGRGDLPVTCTPASGGVFELGTAGIDCRATDPAGNTATESFTVTVQDTTPPGLQVPADIVRHATSPSGAVATYETSASDPVDLSVDIVCDPSSGSTFPLGQTVVTCTATDDSGNSTIDTFTVTVGNSAPSCVATPSTPLIWPPNHQLVPIAINGVTDPDGDGVTIRIDSIFQDEPTNDAGDGNTPVDGFGIGTSLAQIRAERSGRGNGRVYRIGFTATDSIGASCSGAVGVAVPHNQKRAPVDGGALYDSTVF